MNFEENVRELENRGYKRSINNFLNEDQWIKGELIISIHTVRGSSLEYLKAILNQKEQFDFKVVA